MRLIAEQSTRRIQHLKELLYLLLVLEASGQSFRQIDVASCPYHLIDSYLYAFEHIVRNSKAAKENRRFLPLNRMQLEEFRERQIDRELRKVTLFDELVFLKVTQN